jgi:hypothetical protein
MAIMFDPRDACFGVFVLCAILAVLIYIAQGSRRRHNDEQRRRAAQQQRQPATPPGFAVVDDGPGRYRIEGVDRATRMDTTFRIEAQSKANAVAKAELQGVVVTKATREASI